MRARGNQTQTKREWALRNRNESEGDSEEYQVSGKRFITGN